MRLQLTKHLAFFDLETTGIDPVNDRIVEISILKAMPDGNTSVKTWRINPEMPIPYESTVIHGITDEDVKHFTFNWKKGTVYINYCHVGKPVLDVFKDHDTITQGVVPQTHYSADFMIKFGPSTNYLIFVLRKIIINIWLKFQKFKFKNPNIGYIPVADIIGNFDIENYRKFNRVKKIECIK
jgi:hypothetical protein